MYIIEVRLVRACGSKLASNGKILDTIYGQARKSLWIETISFNKDTLAYIGQARKSLWIETTTKFATPGSLAGQARKSLWIETYYRSKTRLKDVGQARKSLWIETVSGLKRQRAKTRSGS